MPFGHSYKIFPYPPVEYIPLHPKNEQIFYSALLETELILTIFLDLHEVKDSWLQKKLPRNWESKKILILIKNGCLQNLYYRGNQVTGVARQIPGTHMLWLIENKYFYKEDLRFSIFSSQGNLLDEKRIKLNIH